jgi:hypothetical protein
VLKAEVSVCMGCRGVWKDASKAIALEGGGGLGSVDRWVRMQETSLATIMDLVSAAGPAPWSPHP